MEINDQIFAARRNTASQPIPPESRSQASQFGEKTQNKRPLVDDRAPRQMLELTMTRKEIVAEIKARGKRPPTDLWTAIARPHWLCASTISSLSILNPVKVCHTRPVAELLGFDKFPAARAGFILG
jgi:hypothetical protein